MAKSKYPIYPILLACAKERFCNKFDNALASSGINNSIHCRESQEMFSVLREQQVSVVLLAAVISHFSGEEMLSRLSKEFPGIPVIIVVEDGVLDSAMQSMEY
ncbi:MAG: hypothetical protein U9P14_07220, partial [Gemmatimonadota bacterium]|nr:hypothetical protein [Gemmatimonadota bacterium]